MGFRPEKLTLDRLDNSQGYCLSNCAWVPRPYQSINTRKTIRLEYSEQEWCLKRLSQFLQVPYMKAYHAYRKGNLDAVFGLPPGSITIKEKK